MGDGTRGAQTIGRRGGPPSRASWWFEHPRARLRSGFLLYLPYVVKLFAIYLTRTPEVRISPFHRVLFRAFVCQMSFQGSSSEDYVARRKRELVKDLNQGTFVGWTEEERAKARRKDMDESVMKEVKGMPSTKGEQPAVRKPTFVGSVNAQRAFSHNLQGAIPPIPDYSSFPAVTEVLRVTDEFCDQYRALRREVEILQEENIRLRRMLERFLTPIQVIPPPPPKE